MVEWNGAETLLDETGHVNTVVMSLALDDLLEETDSQAFYAHVKECRHCLSRWTKWQRMAEVLRIEPFVGPPPGFTGRVDQRIRRQQERKERLLGGLVFLGGSLSVWTLAFLALLATAGMLLLASSTLRLEAIAALGLAGRFVALVLDSRPVVGAGLLPPPGFILAGVAGTLALVWLWGRLLAPPLGETARPSLPGNSPTDNGV